MAYRVLFSTQAAKQFDKLPHQAKEAWRHKLNALADNPRPHGCVKLAGSHNQYRIRAGDYRILYTLDDRRKIITIYRIRHRREVYR